MNLCDLDYSKRKQIHKTESKVSFKSLIASDNQTNMTKNLKRTNISTLMAANPVNGINAPITL